MVTYNKTLTPPEGVEVQETHDGLKFWAVPKIKNSGLPPTVQTEDPGISMHWYGGGRGEGATYLFCFQGFKIGFVRHVHTDPKLTQQNLLPGPDPAPSLNRDPETGIFIDTVTYVGTPVYDPWSSYKRRPDGMLWLSEDELDTYLIDRSKRAIDSFITDFMWSDWNKGQRDKFDSLEQQQAMRAIWAELYPYLYLTPSNTKLVFSDKVLKQFESGELIK